MSSQRLSRPISQVWLWLVLVLGAPVFLGAAMVLAERFGLHRLSALLESGVRLYYAPLQFLPPVSAVLVYGLPSTYAGFGVGAMFYGVVVLLGFVILSGSIRGRFGVRRAG